MKHRLAVAVPGLALLASCVPWTVRPIDDRQSGPFNAERYVDSIWSSKVLPAAAQAADLAPTAPTAPTLVKGEGKVLRVDTTSRSGLIFLDLAPYDGRADAQLQIGPVIRGTALRDALPFIQFSQFTNQLEFARVGNALNDRVVRTVLAGLSTEGLAGRVVSFTGAAAGGAPLEIVPISLVVKP